jgi:hypothetical protein
LQCGFLLQERRDQKKCESNSAHKHRVTKYNSGGVVGGLSNPREASARADAREADERPIHSHRDFAGVLYVQVRDVTDGKSWAPVMDGSGTKAATAAAAPKKKE